MSYKPRTNNFNETSQQGLTAGLDPLRNHLRCTLADSQKIKVITGLTVSWSAETFPISVTKIIGQVFIVKARGPKITFPEPNNSNPYDPTNGLVDSDFQAITTDNYQLVWQAYCAGYDRSYHFNFGSKSYGGITAKEDEALCVIASMAYKDGDPSAPAADIFATLTVRGYFDYELSDSSNWKPKYR